MATKGSSKKSSTPRKASTGTGVSAPELWLEVANVRFDTTGSTTSLQVRLKAERSDSEEQSWRTVESANLDVAAYFKTITEGLDKKRLLYVRVSARDGRMIVDGLRLDYAT